MKKIKRITTRENETEEFLVQCVDWVTTELLYLSMIGEFGKSAVELVGDKICVNYIDEQTGKNIKLVEQLISE
jgi:hypothetical protein